VQAVHAAHEAGIQYGNPHGISSVVLCRVKDEEALLKEAKKLERRGIAFAIFREPDIGDQATALATEPLEPEKRRYLSHLQLWRMPDGLHY
jgi:hypothetical protein